MTQQNFEYAQNFTIAGYDLELTCGACPEQYDVYLCKDQVGYLRLRHGYFRAENSDSVVVYSTQCKGDGVFDDDEREYHLTQAITSIHLDRIGQPLVTTEALIEELCKVMDAEESISKLIDTLAERVANVLDSKYGIYSGERERFIDIKELTQTIKEAIRTK